MALCERSSRHSKTRSTDRLAADIVRSFECCRAPLPAEEIARRDPESLTPRQRELLSEVGYPYALDEFRFHLTLTDSLTEDDDVDAVDAAIADHFAPVAGADVPLTSIVIAVEPHRGRPFAIHSIHPFKDAP